MKPLKMQGLLGAMLQADVPHCVPDAVPERDQVQGLLVAGGRGRRASREAARGARGPAREDRA